MRHGIGGFAALILSICTTAAFADASCSSGGIHGTVGDKGPPEDNVQCQTLGRVFCLVADSRIAGHPQKYAAARAADWLSNLGLTGSHQKDNQLKTVEPIAQYVYTHDVMLPWTAYHRAVYTCGFNKHAPAAQVVAFAPRWEQVADECVKQFPGEGDGNANQDLKDCLYGAMTSLVKEAGQAKK